MQKYILYYSIFAIIALPIGLWFPVKNLIKYDIPITYVQTVVEKEENPGYVGDKDVSERFFKVDKEHLQSAVDEVLRRNKDVSITIKESPVKNIRITGRKITNKIPIQAPFDL